MPPTVGCDMTCEIAMVVFDLDGVLAHLDRTRRLALLAEMTSKDPAFLDVAIWGSDFEASAEAGAYPTGAEYLAELNRRIQGSLRREQWVRARRDSMAVNPGTLAIARELRDRCGIAVLIAVLTNNGSLLHESLAEIVPDVHRIFGDHAHASFQFGARKPQVAVFERLLQRHGVSAARAVFVDDCPEFVAGARRAGMHGIEFAGALGLRRHLNALGLPIELKD